MHQPQPKCRERMLPTTFHSASMVQAAPLRDPVLRNEWEEKGPTSFQAPPSRTLHRSARLSGALMLCGHTVALPHHHLQVERRERGGPAGRSLRCRVCSSLGSSGCPWDRDDPGVQRKQPPSVSPLRPPLHLLDALAPKRTQRQSRLT